MTNHDIHLGIQIVPLDLGAHKYQAIDAAIEVIQQSGVKHTISPMETIIEAPYDRASAVAEKAQEAVLAAGCGEFLVNIRMHIRANASVTMEEKRLDR